MVKYYDDKQIQWLRENNSLNHSLVFWRLATIFYSPKYWYLKTSARVPVKVSSPHAVVQMHTVVHTSRLGTYSWLRAARCPPCVPALSRLIESQHWGSQPGSWLSLCNRLTMHTARKLLPSQQHNVSKKIIFHGNSWFVKCKVHWMQLLTWAKKKESICRSSGRLPWNSSR